MTSTDKNPADESTTPEWLIPDWPVPGHVQALTTLRTGGSSTGPWASLNLAAHVGDDDHAVSVNRQRLIETAGLPDMPVWLTQVHGTGVVDAGDVAPEAAADASFATRSGVVCAVLSADCLPVLLYDRHLNRVAAIHAGWRGLAAGVIEATIATLGSRGEDLVAWLGPAIGPRAFEVGAEVRAAFVTRTPAAGAAFSASGNSDRWYADIYQLARIRLRNSGATRVYGGGLCTFSDAARFYSYRRDGTTGRMATLVWMNDAR